MVASDSPIVLINIIVCFRFNGSFSLINVMHQDITMTESEENLSKLQFKHIKRVLIANRGEIACRVIWSCKKVCVQITL